MSFGIPVRNGLAIGLLASTTLSSRRGLSPALFLDFLQPYLDSRITFSRGTGATRVNASGFIEVVGNTTPRFDYDPVTLAPRGLLIEEARTNLLTYSEQFNDASWTKTNGAVTTNVTASPDGTTSADNFTASAGLAFHYVNRATPASLTGAHTYSFYVKKNTATWIFFTVNDSSINYFNLDTGLFGTTPDTCTATPAGNGWYRITVSRTLAAAVANCGIGVAGSNGGASFTAAGTESIFLWGADLEAGAFATSYIPTVASTVSRSADVAFMSGTNFSSWFNAAQGTFVSSVSSNANASCVLVVSDNTVSNQLFMISTADNILSVYTGGAFQAMLGVTPAAPYVNAGAYATNDFAACSNGGTLSTDTSGSLAGSYARMSIGSNFSGTGVFLNGRIRSIAYYNTRLPNTQLQTLTAPSLASPLALDFISPTYTVGY
jgi:hypothetical protein